MHSLLLDSVQSNGEDTTLFNYFALNDTFSSFPGCGYLGGPDCFEATTPSWIGRSIMPFPNGVELCTALGDTLHLTLPQSPADTNWFFSDPIQRFGIRYLGSDTSTLITIPDSARFYRIVHIDPNGNSITSELHDAPVTIGKMLGTVEFFQIDSFPLVLRRLNAIGDGNHHVGLHTITPAVVHDYQVGDEVQYRHSEYSVFPETLTWNYLRERVLSRLETDSTVSYTMSRTSFSHTGGPFTSTVVNIYSKRDTIATIPFESFHGMHRSMRQIERCGMLFWSYQFDPDNLASPCPFGQCWTPYTNGMGPNPQSSSSHTLGLGSGYWFSQEFIQQWPGQQLVYVSNLHYINYFKKNGIPCGAEQFVGIDEQEAGHRLRIYPVPSNGSFTIESESRVNRIEILDQQGRSIAVYEDAAGSFDLAFAPDGFYFVQVDFVDGTRSVSKVMVMR